MMRLVRHMMFFVSVVGPLQKDHQRHYEGVCLRLDEVC